MTKYRKRPVEIEAAQWFKNGDHPDDNASEMFDYPESPAPDAAVFQRPQVIREGAVVRRYRRAYTDVGPACQHCAKRMRDHGWIDTLEGGHIVCPGDWIIKGIKGEFYPCKPDIFEALYDKVVFSTGGDPFAALNASPALRYEQALEEIFALRLKETNGAFAYRKAEKIAQKALGYLDEPAQGIVTATADETTQLAQPEGLEPGPDRDAPK